MTISHAGNEDDDYSHTADQQSSKSKNQWVHFSSWKKRNVMVMLNCLTFCFLPQNLTFVDRQNTFFWQKAEYNNI